MSSTHPPGPRDWLPFRLYREYARDTLGLLTRLAREYGDVVYVAVPGQRLVLLSNPEHIQQIIVGQHRHFDKANVKIRYLMSQGVSAVTGAAHKEQRHVLQPAFLRERVKDYGPAIVDLSARRADRWQDGATVDMHAEMMELTQEIAGKALFDADVATTTTAAVTRALDAVMAAPRLLFGSGVGPLLQKLPFGSARHVAEARQHLRDVVDRMITEHRQPDARHNDLLTVLLRVQAEQGPDGSLTDEVIRDQVLNLFLTGHETTANGLSWCWYLLAKHPEVQERLAVELTEVLAGQLPSADDVAKLPYTEAVFAEALRLYPPIWTIVRTAEEACEVAGYRLEAGTTVLMSQWVVQRDPRHYPQPERFDPERMAPAARADRHRFAYFPFGGGPRQCLGEQFAWLEVSLILATLIQKWRVRLVSDAPVLPDPHTTLRPRDGVRVKLERRAPGARP